MSSYKWLMQLVTQKTQCIWLILIFNTQDLMDDIEEIENMVEMESSCQLMKETFIEDESQEEAQNGGNNNGK